MYFGSCSRRHVIGDRVDLSPSLMTNSISMIHYQNMPLLLLSAFAPVLLISHHNPSFFNYPQASSWKLLWPLPKIQITFFSVCQCETTLNFHKKLQNFEGRAKKHHISRGTKKSHHVGLITSSCPDTVDSFVDSFDRRLSGPGPEFWWQGALGDNSSEPACVPG